MDKCFSTIDNGYDIEQVSSYINELNIKIEYFKYLENLIDTKIIYSIDTYDKIISNTHNEINLHSAYYNEQLETIQSKIKMMKSNLTYFISNIESLNLDIAKIKSVDIVDLLDTMDSTLNILDYKAHSNNK